MFFNKNYQIKENFDQGLVIGIFKILFSIIQEDEDEKNITPPHKFSGQVYGLIHALAISLIEEKDPELDLSNLFVNREANK